jgi:hypothetical protein
MASPERHSLKRTATVCIVAGTFALLGCAGAAPQTEATRSEITGNPPELKSNRDKEPDYATVVARAEREVKRAADKGFLWLNTEAYLAASREAQKAGNLEEAMKLAQKALDEALLAQKQAAEGANTKADYSYRR